MMDEANPGRLEPGLGQMIYQRIDRHSEGKLIGGLDPLIEKDRARTGLASHRDKPGKFALEPKEHQPRVIENGGNIRLHRDRLARTPELG
jgi:hypothetical protein